MHPDIRKGAVVWVVLSLSLAASFVTFHSALQARRMAAEHRLANGGAPVRDAVPWEVLVAGLLGSMLLTGITGSLVRTRSRSDALAAAMSAQLQVRSDQFRDLAGHAETLARAQGEFLGDMSRDLRTPLTRMIGCAGKLLENPDGNLGKRDLAYLSRIRDDGNQLLSQVDSILDLARIESGRMELEWSEVDLVHLAREASVEAETRGRGRGVEIVLDVPVHCRPVRADAAKLRQVVLDLLEDPLKLMERGKATLRVRVAGERPLALEVEVDGSQPVPGGSSLGVNRSRALVRLMGLDLEVADRPGTGLVLSIRVPTDPRTAHPAALTPRSAARR